MKKVIRRTTAAVALAVITALCTACSRSIDMDKLKGSWTCTPEQGEPIVITITDEYFTQSSGGETGAQLKYERNPDGINVRNSDGKVLFTLYYSEKDNTVSYTVKDPGGEDLKLTFSRNE